MKVDLAAVDPADVALEIRGRQLVIAGERRPTQEAGGRLYQQIEIEHGPFRRIVELGADVVADEATRLVRRRRPAGGDPARRAGAVGAARADLGRQ